MGSYIIWIIAASTFALFNANSAWDICETGAIDVTSNYDYINSPDFSPPGSYAPNLNCRTNIFSSTREIKSITLTFHSFDLEWNDICRDSLFIDGKEYCGYYDYYELCFPQSSLELEFRSDDNEATNENHRGFEIWVDISETNQCECLAEADEGQIAQPCVFPFTYQGVTYHQCAGNAREGEKTFCAVQVDDNGVLSDESNKKFCDESLEACVQKCLTTQGDQCFFPSDNGAGVCSLEQESDKNVSCPTLKYKDGANYEDISTAESGTCQMDSCIALDTCSTERTATDGWLISSDIPYISDSYVYPTDFSCSFKYFAADEYLFFEFNFEKLDVHCEDALRIGDASNTFSYNLCSKPNASDSFRHYLIIPASNVTLSFETSQANAGPVKKSGFLFSYQLIPFGEPTLENDEACSLPVGRIVTEPQTLFGKFYPEPYPANTFCLWTIVPPSDLAVIVHVLYIDLGVNHDEFEVIDSLEIVDAAGRNSVFLPGLFPPFSFVSLPGETTIRFESGYLFNWHGNFYLDVSFFNFTENLNFYAEAGLCVSRETPDVCQIPFTFEGREYKVCDYLEATDEKPSCISYTGKKVVCDETVVACGRQFPTFSTYSVEYDPQYDTEKNVYLNWTFANNFWESFEVYVDDVYNEGLAQEQRFLGVFDSSHVSMRVDITVYGYIDQPQTFHLILYPDLGIEVTSNDDFESVVLKWEEGKGYTDIMVTEQLSQNGLNSNYVEWIQSLQLIEVNLYDDLADTITEYTVEELLTPGIIYDVMLLGSSGETFVLTIPPEPIKQIFIEQHTYTSVTISGKLTEETICYSISFSISKITSTSSSRKRRETGGSETTVECSFDNNCIDSAGDYSLTVTDQMSEPDTCYDISATSSTASGVKSNSSETLTHCTPKQSDGDVIPPKIVDYDSDTELTEILVHFYVDGNFHGFDYVILYFYDSASDSYSPEGYVCSASDGIFESGVNHTCSLPGLKSNTPYSIALKGHDLFEENDTFTEMSQPMEIELEGNDDLYCGPDYFSGGFHSSDILSPESSFTFQTSSVFTSQYGTPFNEQDFIQNTWGDRDVFVPPESTHLFRGYPSSIEVSPYYGDHITSLFSHYKFAADDTKLRINANVFPTASWFDLELDGSSQGVISVSGSFEFGYLSSIQFISTDINKADGDTIVSPCFGSDISPCAHFQVNRTDPNQFLVGFSGKIDSFGRFVELNLIWATKETFFLGSTECPLVGDYTQWFDFARLSTKYEAGYQDCGTTRIVDTTDTVTYENRIVSGKALSAPATEDPTNEEFGDGTMMASRSWSSGGVIIQCVFDADGVVSARFDTTPHESTGMLTQTKAVEFQMLFYTDMQYTTPRSTPNGIIKVSSGEKIPFAVSFANNQHYDMTLYAYTCYAKKTDDPEMAEDGSNYLLLENEGCPAADDTFKRDLVLRDVFNYKMDPMSISAFHWFNDYFSLVHIHCRVRACVSDNQEHCEPPPTCGTARARREASLGKSEYESFVSSPPIKIETNKNMFIQQLEAQSTVNWIWIPLSLACGLSVALIVIAVDRSRKRRTPIKYEPLPQNT